MQENEREFAQKHGIQVWDERQLTYYEAVVDALGYYAKYGQDFREAGERQRRRRWYQLPVLSALTYFAHFSRRAAFTSYTIPRIESFAAPVVLTVSPDFRRLCRTLTCPVRSHECGYLYGGAYGTLPVVTFEWDSDKDRIDHSKHGVSFDEAQLAFADPKRVIAIDHKHTVRFTIRDEKIRIFGAGLWKEGRQVYEGQNQVP